MLEMRNEKVAIPVVLLAGILWSFGPLVVRHIDQPELVPWQYLLGRGVTIFLILIHSIFAKTVFEPGLVDSPPTSIIFAPVFIMLEICFFALFR